jgi:hypothetical protein
MIRLSEAGCMKLRNEVLTRRNFVSVTVSIAALADLETNPSDPLHFEQPSIKRTLSAPYLLARPAKV